MKLTIEINSNFTDIRAGILSVLEKNPCIVTMKNGDIHEGVMITGLDERSKIVQLRTLHGEVDAFIVDIHKIKKIQAY